MRVLLADNNPDNREMLTRRLERRGFVVDEAEDGAVAVAAANNNRPDVVLLDLSLPVVNGLEAARALRASPATADLKIIALAANDTGSPAGCDAVALKPVDFAGLMAMIERVTGRQP